MRCAIQSHAIPVDGSGSQLTYHLAFLEFDQNGQPYALEALPGDEVSDPSIVSQLDALRSHLASHKGKNYVIAFVHGWRHNAAIGDENIAGLRTHAAHVASFLAQRCAREHRYCGTEVTAVYVGWRGARVNERLILATFGYQLGSTLAAAAALPTLFDRKPVSEAIAPSVISALSQISGDLRSYNQEAGAHLEFHDRVRTQSWR